jgi:hypothetical protein
VTQQNEQTQNSKDATSRLWKYYQVKLQFQGPFAAAIPADPKEIRAMLENRMPANQPDNALPIDELAEQAASEVGVGPDGDEEARPGHSTFKRDEKGLYYEGRCVRGHLKDCASQVAFSFPHINTFRARVANATYVITDKIYLGKAEIDGTEQRFIQIMTQQGPRSTYKFIDYVMDPAMTFTLKLLNNGVILEEHLRAIFEYGGTHGMGQERSQGWGRYVLEELTDLNPEVPAARPAAAPGG